MKIAITFLNGSDYWRNLVTFNAEIASTVLSDPSFIAWIAAQPYFDDTPMTPAQVAQTIAQAEDVRICVGFYSKWLTRAIAYEEDGCIYFNTRKEAAGAGGTENLVHEVCHSLGFHHRGNSPKGQENTVPWAVGREAGAWKIAWASKVDKVDRAAIHRDFDPHRQNL